MAGVLKQEAGTKRTKLGWKRYIAGCLGIHMNLLIFLATYRFTPTPRKEKRKKNEPPSSLATQFASPGDKICWCITLQQVCMDYGVAAAFVVKEAGLHAEVVILYWVAVKELKLSYHNSDTILFTVYPYYGNLI